jgi:hypothetical protein
MVAIIGGALIAFTVIGWLRYWFTSCPLCNHGRLLHSNDGEICGATGDSIPVSFTARDANGITQTLVREEYQKCKCTLRTKYFDATLQSPQ